MLLELMLSFTNLDKKHALFFVAAYRNQLHASLLYI